MLDKLKHACRLQTAYEDLLIYLHLLCQDAAEGVNLRVGRSTCGHPGRLLRGPEHPAGTVSPQPAHTAGGHKHTQRHYWVQ